MSRAAPAGDAAAHQDRIVQRVDRERRLHPPRDRVAHDLSRVHVLERATVDLARASPVLGDLDQPQLV